MGVLLALEHEWAQACQLLDVGVLDKILAQEFRLSFVTDPRAPKTLPRDNWFSMLDRMSLGGYEIQAHQVFEFGEVGVFHANLNFIDWKLDGTTLPSEYRVTDVFIRREGRWQCINRISEPTEKAPDFGEF